MAAKAVTDWHSQTPSCPKAYDEERVGIVGVSQVSIDIPETMWRLQPLNICSVLRPEAEAMLCSHSRARKCRASS